MYAVGVSPVRLEYLLVCRPPHRETHQYLIARFDCAPSLLHLGNWRQTLACPKIKKPMDGESTAPIRAQASRRYDQSRARLARLPAPARIILGFFLLAAALLALPTASTAKHATLPLP